MYVIFDLHHSAPGTTLASDQQPMPDRDHAPAYWRSVAEQFKHNHAVVFDLYNEPYPDDNRDTTVAWTCVRDGGTCPGVDFIAAGTQELVNAVRAAGATDPILISGPQYAGVLDQWLAYEPNDIGPLTSWNDRHGVSYLAWAWFSGECAGEPALISSYEGTPTAFGAGVRSHLLSLRR